MARLAKQDFLTKKEKDDLRKAAHRLEAVFKSVKERNGSPPQPENIMEFNLPSFALWQRIVQATAAVTEAGLIVGMCERADQEK